MFLQFDLPEELILDLAAGIKARDDAETKKREDKIIRQEIRYLTREVPYSSIAKRN
jgi:hypothetical protein